ncbi:recombinase family protein [Vagococcus sp. BWB3-3]|uniref:Recombinase family protein n=1 Tax=Vagococcus allomyrinae TaxID=2794353 RepID=A0A940SYA2_9ENTE|nr:recombinase family protein [Vagococcus allomyrinae]MBP1044231.1 recombinase family protein [Vagococcus allomyrinae]
MTIYGYVKRQFPLATNEQLKIVMDYPCAALFIDERYEEKELHELMNQLDSGDQVVVASLQVFGSNVVEASEILTYLKRNGIQVLSWSTYLHLDGHRPITGLF